MTVKLYDLIDPQNPDAVESDVVAMMSEIDPAFEAVRLRTLYRDIVRLFHGDYPGYRRSDAWYHDLEHTSTVFLCTAAMVYGAHHDGVRLSSRGKLLVLACALFHDVGLIRRKEEDGRGTGARFTIGHEERSVAFMESYFREHGYDLRDIEDARQIIECTILGKSPADIPFRTEEVKTLGRILGSADVVAQMADRAYLEKLLLLYREFREGGIPGYESELDLLEKTPGFYHNVVKRRLDSEFDRADDWLDVHARVYWQLDRDPYRASIERNLTYLDRILEGDKTQYREWLRRHGVVEKLLAGGTGG